MDKDRLTQVGRALDRLGDRAYPGLLAGSARTLGAHVRHAAGPLAEGAQACGHQRHRRRPIGSSARSICRRTMPASPSRRRSRRAPLCRSPIRRGLAEILCVAGGAGRRARQHRRLCGPAQLQLPQSRARPHYVKARVKVHEYPDGALAVFHGPRPLARYDAAGQPPQEARRLEGRRVTRFDAQLQWPCGFVDNASASPTSPTSQQQKQTEADK